MNEDKDADLNEIKVEATTTTKDGNIIDTEVEVKCKPCIDDRHSDCELSDCSCARNNHQGS